MPFGLHWYDLAVVLLLAMLLFGAKRLPQIGNAFGATIREFKRSMKDVSLAPSASLQSSLQSDAQPPATHTTRSQLE